ncbi:unnamed protein product [Staurois parvus]|uniref:Uncharacterized protein n=1 Tax=Staurois parvus TaxID=386267 RepID=A0ABN9BX97_9NEOB|nr:unnamed protein product [Staurois parvus]
MGPCTASSCCCQARNLPWAPVPTPHAAARPVICHGAPVPPPHAAARSRVSHGSLYGLPLLLSPSPHSAMCHFQVSSHCWWVPFCHRVLYGLPLLLPPPPHCGSTLWFWPRDCPNECEVCDDSKIDGTHLHAILTDSIIYLPQQTPRAFKLKVQCSALI